MTSYRWLFHTTATLLLGAPAGCGGATQFAAAEPLVIAGTPPILRKEDLTAPPRVELRDNRIEITERVQFDVDKATIRDESSSLLHDVAEVIRKNPGVKRIAIEGHASAEGDALHNRRLSDERSKAVKDQLVKKEGLAPDRFVSRGWGEERPLASNDTEEGREKNRRVEFVVVEQDVTSNRIEIDGTTGSERVIGETKSTYYIPAMPAPTGAETPLDAPAEAMRLERTRAIGAKQSEAKK